MVVDRHGRCTDQKEHAVGLVLVANLQAERPLGVVVVGWIGEIQSVTWRGLDSNPPSPLRNQPARQTDPGVPNRTSVLGTASPRRENMHSVSPLEREEVVGLFASACDVHLTSHTGNSPTAAHRSSKNIIRQVFLNRLCSRTCRCPLISTAGEGRSECAWVGCGDVRWCEARYNVAMPPTFMLPQLEHELLRQRRVCERGEVQLALVLQMHAMRNGKGGGVFWGSSGRAPKLALTSCSRSSVWKLASRCASSKSTTG